MPSLVVEGVNGGERTNEPALRPLGGLLSLWGGKEVRTEEVSIMHLLTQMNLCRFPSQVKMVVFHEQ